MFEFLKDRFYGIRVLFGAEKKPNVEFYQSKMKNEKEEGNERR